MTSIEGIEKFPVFSFVMFFVFFILLTAYVVFERKDYFDQMSQMPLADTDNNEPEKTEKPC